MSLIHFLQTAEKFDLFLADCWGVWFLAGWWGVWFFLWTFEAFDLFLADWQELDLFLTDCWGVPKRIWLSSWLGIFSFPWIHVWRHLGCCTGHSTRGSSYTSYSEERNRRRLSVSWPPVGRFVSRSASQHQFRRSYGKVKILFLLQRLYFYPVIAVRKCIHTVVIFSIGTHCILIR
jgi:hypothetical protein